MIKRKKKIQKQPDYSAVDIILEKHTFSVSASINHEIKDKRRRDSDTKIYKWDTRLELYGRCTYPEESHNEAYQLSIFGSPRHEHEFLSTLEDYHVIENWNKVYRTVKGISKPVYNPPDGLPGMIELQRGSQLWRGCLWLPPQTVTNMVALLSRPQPHYVSLNRFRGERCYFITSISLQTYDPEEE